LVFAFTAVSALSAIAYGAALTFGGIPVLSAIYGKGYVEYAGLFPILAVNLVLITASQGVQVGLRAMNAPREVFFGFLISGAFTCTAGIAMTYMWQLTGAVIGLCCSTFLFLCYVLWRYRSLLRRPG